MTYTTQQLQAMSDFEVNKALCLKLGYDVSGINEQRNMMTGAVIDYCNNPNDIMPLAFERKIAIFPYSGKWISVKGHSWIDFNGPHEELAPIDTDGEYFMSESPLRAIACILLMMDN